MIKFFRQFRESILMKNQKGRYFKYAIGEILLVVIGILIALSINNWNDMRIQKKNVFQLSKRLLEETKRNIADFSYNHEFALKSKNSVLLMLQLMNEDYTKVDKRLMDSLIFNALTSPTIDFNDAVLKEALSTGQLANFKNDSLKNILYSIPTKLSELKNREKSLLDDNTAYFVPLIYKHTSLRQVDYQFSGFGDAIKKSNLKETDNRVLLQMREFENVMDNQFYLFNRLTTNYQEIQSLLQTLHALLQKQIDAH